MDIKEYIETGIVGSYVLGLASDAERLEFESLCKEHPELNDAVRSFEMALEAQLMQEAVSPPPGLKEKILLSLKSHDTGILQLHQKENKKLVQRINVWRLLTAACLLLLLGNICVAYYLNKRSQTLQTANIELKKISDHPDYADAINALKPIVAKPSTKWSAILEPANSAHCMAHIYWDSISTNTFLLIGNIPKPVSDKQFQLWAILDNNPINLGVFDIKKEGQLMQMKNVPKAKTFVITIEKKGGSSTPTMAAMYAIGKP